MSLFGACVVRGVGPSGFEITGAKHKALFALLATAPLGRCTRAFLQEMLWGQASFDGGRQSLRRALSDIKKVMGPVFDSVISANNTEIRLNLAAISFLGSPAQGEFLAGIQIHEAGFKAWIAEIRRDPSRVLPLLGVSQSAHGLSLLPMVSVLPFRLVLGDAQHAMLGDWLAEQICRSLSRSNLVGVISHLSARAVTQDNADLGVMQARLDIDYCLSGSIRVLGTRLYLDADLIDARQGRILWTRNFEGDMRDFLTGDSAAEHELVAAVGRSVANEALQHASNRALSDIEDHHLIVAGVGLMHQLRLKSFAHAREMLLEAIRRSPRSAEAHAWLGDWYVKSVFNGWSTDIAADTQRALDATAKALDIDPENALSLMMDGVVHTTLTKHMDTAEDRFDTALKYNPNEAMSHLQKGILHTFRDETDLALQLVGRARALSPADPYHYFYDSLSASAHLAAGNFQTAVDLCEASMRANPRHHSTLRAYVAALHNLGRSEDAQAAAQSLQRDQPHLTIRSYQTDHPASDRRLGTMVAEALRATGIPEGV
ncbi:hypothetical protein [Shimia ponticola]|uniref:hypothetical protein n=1 Tax=Shimia ponticola TaxID=2582893 RepID=UPI001C9A8A87|nr:hypothetical protein [Shimia ponticola]